MFETDNRAHCLNCSVPDGAYVYCDHLLEMADTFDGTGETMACIHYQYDRAEPKESYRYAGIADKETEDRHRRIADEGE